MIGETLGPYKIVDKIGLGGMATVYKAYQPALQRHVAVKVLPPHLAESPGFAQRFQQEALTVARLEHPHILPVYDFGQEGGKAYIVSRYIEGGTLRGIMGTPVDLPRIAVLIGQIAEALDYAHEQGVVHRDVKPSNVLLDSTGRAYLTDFGVARILEATQQITGTGVGVGTPAYMSPEQGQGRQVDRRSDVYSLGVVLYEMLTGQVPYQAETPVAVVMKHINDPLPSPRQMNAEVPESVERVVVKALAKSAQDRYQTAGEMASALRRATIELPSRRLIVKELTRPGGADEGKAHRVLKAISRFWWGIPAILAGLWVAASLWSVLRGPARPGATSTPPISLSSPQANPPLTANTTAQSAESVTAGPMHVPLILIDEMHNEKDIVPESELALFRTYLLSGFRLERHALGALTEAILGETDVLVVASPREGFSSKEIEAVARFVELGGGVLAWTDARLPESVLDPLLDPFDIAVHSDALLVSSGAFPHRPWTFWAGEMRDHEVTRGVETMLVDHGGSLELGEGSFPLVLTDAETRRDTNANLGIDPGEPKGPFVLAAGAEYGGGRVLVVSDSLLTHLEDNAVLLLNAITWLARFGD